MPHGPRGVHCAKADRAQVPGDMGAKQGRARGWKEVGTGHAEPHTLGRVQEVGWVRPV